MDTIPAKTILSRVASGGGWFGVDYNMNLYRGCTHGCIYCDSRSDCYRIDDFDRVRLKENCLPLLRDELRRKVRTGVVGTGAMSDPYNPFEETTLATRHALELLAAYAFGVAIATKSDLITRDIDILQEIAAQAPVLCKITITSADDRLAAQVEPRAPSSSARFAALAELAAAGVYCGVLLMPVLPFLEDNRENVLEIVRRAAASGAKFIYAAFGMTMRDGQRAYFYDRLEERFPGLRARYAKRYGDRYQCTSPRARALWETFTEACAAQGLLFDMKTIIRDYKRGYDGNQLSFL